MKTPDSSDKMLFQRFILATTVISVVKASHFRGGTISWEHLGNTSNVHQVEFSFRLGWRRDFGGPVCDEDMIANQSQIYDYGSWAVSGAYSLDFPQSVKIVCTSYDQGENWAYGFNSFLANVTTYGPFVVIFSGNAWIGSLLIGPNSVWSVALVNIDFGSRSDTGQVNHPPSTLSSPVIRIQQGCPTTIKINVIDDDNDVISCRYALTSTECGGVCGQYPHFQLNSTTCTIDYDGGGINGTVPVALMLEDHPRQPILLDGNRFVSTSNALSSVPLQFLVKITSTSACNAIPSYPSSSVTNNAVVTVPDTGSLNETLFAYASDLSHTIVQFVVIGPVGVLTSSIFSPSFGLFGCYITWQPTPAQSGDHLVCYYAVDSSGKSGTQVCFIVKVAAISNPCDIDNGGCDDVCVPRNSSSYCACSKSCWILADDRKSCIPNMNVTCDGSGMDISIDNCASSRTVVAGEHLDHFTQPICQSIETSSSHILSLRTDECGVQIQTNPIVLKYVADVWIWESFVSHSSVITRGEWRNIPVSCSLPWTSNLTGSFVPIPPLNDEFFPHEVEIAGMGEFSFYFEYYRTSSFANTYSPSDYPIQVTVNDDIFFSLGAYGRGGLTFFTEQCIAMSGRTIDTSTLIYPFIDNGCLLDPTLVRYNTSINMQEKFSINAFEFEEKLLLSREDAEIFIQCQVVICDASRNDTRCVQGCLPGGSRGKRSAKIKRSHLVAKSRGKRDDDDDDDDLPELVVEQSPPQDIGSRFIIIVDNAPKPENSSDLTTYIFIGGVIAFVAVVGLLVAYLVVRRRRARKENPDG